MKFLVDANLSYRVAMLLRAAGHDAIAVRDVGLQDEPDDTILDFAIGEDRVIVSNDSDFGDAARVSPDDETFLLCLSGQRTR